MPRIEFDIPTSLPPEKVKAMLLDFSDRRPDTWPGLGRDQYKVYSIGETSAEIREGNKRPNVWARERYDWERVVDEYENLFARMAGRTEPHPPFLQAAAREAAHTDATQREAAVRKV